MMPLLTTEKHNSEINNCFEYTYLQGIENSINTMSGVKSIEQVIKRIYELSYIAEGPRHFEAVVCGKINKIYNELKKESHEIYEKRIIDYYEYICETPIKNINEIPMRTFNQAHADISLDKFKKFNIPRYARILYYLQNSFPNSDLYAAGKILRMLKLNDKNEFLINTAKQIVPVLKNYQTKQLERLPDNINPLKVSVEIPLK